MNKSAPINAPGRGFTLLELIIAMAIAAMVLAVSVPASVKLYQGMQYRSAVSDVITLLASARYGAVKYGVFQDVLINPEQRELRYRDEVKQLPDGLGITIQSAKQLSREQSGVVRFYPEGGSSGADIDIENQPGVGVRIKVDWLLGQVTQEKYDTR